MEIDQERPVYLFLHGREDLRQGALAALTSAGFDASVITDARPDRVGKVGDYMAMLWMPPTPDKIKIQQITGIEEVEPEGMAGLWRGVAKDDVGEIPLS
ncbi:MAG: hypothetical protein MPI95_06015 [Nitrosopumilus sp.]|nr:hypothetical protein [Nitrosopumilus sp.]CAI9832494.1 conserved hypothetical protein [Nitrosopumilaceae archaeon]MDA7941512.1 hypothetical protein [Nitrosopumilus sp.]MDA7943346.1 hypothetical protein [Nitrosopumilus sp.]MDA7944794.1 hypothetical protein [Nitrosopumilus sp.]